MVMYCEHYRWSDQYTVENHDIQSIPVSCFYAFPIRRWRCRDQNPQTLRNVSPEYPILARFALSYKERKPSPPGHLLHLHRVSEEEE